MGGRGAFLDVDTKDFRFVLNGQTFVNIGEVDGVKVLQRVKPYSVKAPEYSHTENRIYAIVQDGKLKHLSFYDENHKQYKVIDFGHPHGTNHVIPHVHSNLEHVKNEPGTSPSKQDLELATKIERWLRR